MRLILAALALLCCASADFEESLARNFMLPLAAAAYSDAPQQCLDKTIHGAKLRKQVTVKCDSFHDKCSGFTFVDDKHSIIGISFRGSNNPAQMAVEIQETAFQPKVDFVEGGQVSKYFNDAFRSVWDGGLEEEVSYLIMTYPDYDLWITGHSLGGALASLATAEIISMDLFDKSRIFLYTFGQPRIGDQMYADVHDKLVKESYRVVHGRDLIVHAPAPVYKYVHHKNEVIIKTDENNHFFRDIHVCSTTTKEDDSYQVCTRQEDQNCSDEYTFGLTLADHTNYYGKNVSDFGQSGCK
ncbi:hypothetical protein PRIPAC_97698 [Pristionchus pacificus]|uniref:Lipase n=1 Tax=Pristionchus pacificus TaxID=54126 RepID=A0A2A6D2M5_PRIPA|nr:hypothetical protein PRIPAC_97698 [Pristionchus pacificus]|eukprot:PDM84640.1 lipase [Pristionchus pacificus]